MRPAAKLEAHKNGAQMAVFSNGLLAGLIQLWGVEGSGSAYPWHKTYRLYTPRDAEAAARLLSLFTRAEDAYFDNANDIEPGSVLPRELSR